MTLTAFPAHAATHSAGASATERALHQLVGPHGSVSENVCSYGVVPGHAHCNDSRRIDAGAELAQPARDHADSLGVLGNGGAYDPSYLQSAYNVAALTAARLGGSGQIVAIVDAYDDPNVAADLAHYRSYFNLPPCTLGAVSPSATTCTFEKVNEAGASAPLPSTNASWGTEISLDVEMVSAICPSCQILLVEASSNSLNDLGQSVNTAVSIGATVVSNSYGGSEYNSEDTDSGAYFNHPGVPIVAASGDSGYGVEFPAASPLVTAVGGTTLTQLTNTGTRNGTESAWSGAGAGCSGFEPKPTWQHDSGCAMRTVADVSAVANPATGVWVYDTFGASGFAIYGGTSVATPIVASIYALSADSSSSTAVPASWLYAAPSSLIPVTTGSDGSCGTYLCNAAASQGGYNGPTGLGTPGGSPSSLSAFSGSTAPAKAPDSPTLMTATAGNASVSLSWSAPQHTGGSAITGYNLFVGTSAGGESNSPATATPITTTTFTLSGLVNGTTYYFSVQALNAIGSSPSSNELSATPVALSGPPGAPILLTVSVANSSATLTWSPVSGATGYNIYLGGTSGGEASTPTNGTPTTATSYTAVGLNNGVTYYFIVRALNAAGSSTPSNELSGRPGLVPGAPSALSATSAKRGNIQLSWHAPSSPGTSPVTGYIVLRGTSSGTEAALVTVSCSTSVCSWNDRSAQHSITYFYVVRAVNSIGSGPRSNEVSATTR